MLKFITMIPIKIMTSSKRGANFIMSGPAMCIGRFGMKRGCLVHLYISTSTCLFSWFLVPLASPFSSCSQPDSRISHSCWHLLTYYCIHHVKSYSTSVDNALMAMAAMTARHERRTCAFSLQTSSIIFKLCFVFKDLQTCFSEWYQVWT